MAVDTRPRLCQVFPSDLPNRVRNDPARSAEVRLYDRLRLQLGAGWVIFYSVAWLGLTTGDAPRDGEADFVVAHPAKGVLVIEVKGGRIRFDGERQQWISRDRYGTDHPIDPFNQVRQSKHALIRKLRDQPALRDRWVEVSHAVAFPDVERPRQAPTLDAPPEILIGGDDLDRLQARIEEILAFSQGERGWPAHGQRTVQELIRLLARSTELRNPLSLQAAEEDREIVRLTEEQFRILDLLNRVRRAAISGTAGSGKTFLAVEKARRLAGEGFRTLLTCFNRPLADFLGRVAERTEGLDVLTFHALCAKMADEAGITFADPGPRGDVRFGEEYPDALARAMQQLPNRRYDAIVVDEGQDFQETWWLALEECLAGGRESILYIFYDDHQLLYRGTGTLPGDMTEFPLTENVRNTRAICRVLAKHYATPIHPRGPAGRTVEAHTYKEEADLCALLARILHRLLVTEHVDHRDLAVLTPKALDRSLLPRLQLPASLRLVTADPPGGRHDVLLSTVHRFKGLERRVVLVAELDADLQRDPDYRATVCYVAFSRPRTHLVLLGTPDVLPGLLPDPT